MLRILLNRNVVKLQGKIKRNLFFSYFSFCRSLNRDENGSLIISIKMFSKFDLKSVFFTYLRKLRSTFGYFRVVPEKLGRFEIDY
jgi:hypothetical protein